MDFAIGSTGIYNQMTRTKPMNYTLENQSQVSSAYQQTVEHTSQSAGFQPVGAANPVQYPNQKSVVDNAWVSVQRASEAGKQFNAVAQNFAGQVTGYSAESAATGYELIGSQFDAFV